MTLNIETIIGLLTGLGTLALAGITAYNVYISIKETKIAYYTEKIEGFYLPLINILSSATFKCKDTYENLNRIIKEKAYLAESNTQRALPSEDSWMDSSFNSLSKISCTPSLLDEFISLDSTFIYFSDQKNFDQWQKFADVLWEDYINILKELNKLKGIKTGNDFKKPEWRLRKFSPPSNGFI